MLQFKNMIIDNKKSILISLAIIAISIILACREGTESSINEDGIIKRGKSRQNIMLDIDIGDFKYNNIEVEVEKRKYKASELHDYFIKSHDLIKDLFDNDTGLKGVEGDLSFPDTLPDSPLTYEWNPLDKNVIDETGKVLVPYKTTTSVKVTATYGEWSESDIFEITLCPGESIKQRYVKEKLVQLISETNESSITDDIMVLPKEIDGIPIRYQERKHSKSVLLAAGLVLAGLVFAASVYDKRTEAEKRKKEILSEYPIVIQKLVMYISGGMTVRNAWSRICLNASINEKKKIIYEEMITTENEILTGVSEGVCYEHFGERINDNSVIRFTTLLSQNIRKGSTSLGSILKKESVRAFETRKNEALKRGEEAGTKLLLPMIIILVMVTVIIMVPAFWSM